jgi:hypothetical protein
MAVQGPLRGTAPARLLCIVSRVFAVGFRNRRCNRACDLAGASAALSGILRYTCPLVGR